MQDKSRIKIKNWSTFQHFKDRRPPWIKLHREILDQRDIMMLSPQNFRVLTCLWLLASEDKNLEGTLPPIEDIAYRLRIPESEIVKAIQELENFLDHDDINAISERYQVDAPETETQEQTQVETEAYLLTKNTFENFWNLFPAQNLPKGSKLKAEQSYNKALAVTNHETIMQGVNNYAAYIKSDGTNKTCHAVTWLNQHRWEDDYSYAIGAETRTKTQRLDDSFAEAVDERKRKEQGRA